MKIEDLGAKYKYWAICPVGYNLKIRGKDEHQTATVKPTLQVPGRGLPRAQESSSVCPTHRCGGRSLLGPTLNQILPPHSWLAGVLALQRESYSAGSLRTPRGDWVSRGLGGESFLEDDHSKSRKRFQGKEGSN